MVELFKGDCLVESLNIENGSVDLILTDPPYGNMGTEGGRKLGITNWDKTIPPLDLFTRANNLLRKNGKLILFSQEPYTFELMANRLPNLAFNYRATWVKDNFANALGVNKNLVSYTEDILIFTKINPVHDTEFTHPLRPYFEKLHGFILESKADIIREVGQGADHVFRYGSSQFALCTAEIYTKLIDAYKIDKMQGFKPFLELVYIDAPFKSDLLAGAKKMHPSVFNLWDGKKHKGNVFTYKKDYDGHHPTQKPVALLEDLIQTFTNEGDLVVDLTMGSGSTGVAAVNTGRPFKGVEQNEDFFNISKKRISDAEAFNLF